MAHPTAKGQRYQSGKNIFTVKCFHGKDGVFYDSFNECKKKNPEDKMVLVVNNQYGGSTDVKNCTLIA